jgi:hypothetical protein
MPPRGNAKIKRNNRASPPEKGLHQALDMGYPADRFAPSQQDPAAGEALLPLRLPASLQPADSPQPTAAPTQGTPTRADLAEPLSCADVIRKDTCPDALMLSCLSTDRFVSTATEN